MAVDYRVEAPDIVKDFLRFEKKNKDHSDKTIKEYFLDLRTFFRFMKQERGIAPENLPFEKIEIQDIKLDFVKGITKVDINNYIDYLRSDHIGFEGQQNEVIGLAASTTQRRLATLKSFFHYLCDSMGYLEANPTIGVTPPMSRKRLPAYLTEEESRRLLDAVQGINASRDYCIILIFLNSGLRVSELVGIDIADIRQDEDQHFLNIIGKGNKERQVYLAPACMEAINDYLVDRKKIVPIKGAEDALFLSRKRARMSVSAVQDMVKNTLQKANLSTKKYSVHKLRHTAATLMLQNGVDVRTLQEVLGHAQLNTTQLYTHVSSDDLRVAAQANPLGVSRKRIEKINKKANNK